MFDLVGIRLSRSTISRFLNCVVVFDLGTMSAAPKSGSITVARKRLMRDFKKIKNDQQEMEKLGVSATPVDDDIMKWHAAIFGPADTPWEGGTFQLEVNFCEEFPNKPPQVRFLNKMFHPNIYNDGQICLDILQNQWSPIYDISAILTSIQSLLTDPNPNSPANNEAARLYADNRREYDRRVQNIVESSWDFGGSDEDDTEMDDETSDPSD